MAGHGAEHGGGAHGHEAKAHGDDHGHGKKGHGDHGHAKSHDHGHAKGHDDGHVASKSHGGKESPTKAFLKELAKDIYEIGNFSDLITFTGKIAKPIALDTAKGAMETPANLTKEAITGGSGGGGGGGHHH